MTDRGNTSRGIEHRLRILEVRIEEINDRLGLLDEQARQGLQAQLAIARIVSSAETQGANAGVGLAGIAHLASMVEHLHARVEELAGTIAHRGLGLADREVA